MMTPIQQNPRLQQQNFIDVSTAASASRERAFIRSVYGWMFGGLLLTALASWWVVVSPAMQQIVARS
ncbi:MAG: hypothetical protein ABI718_11745, partial [Acidobacteriota bacterium]